MSNYLETIDRSILFAINDFHFPFLDKIMWIISNKFAWIPLAVMLCYLSYKKFDPKRFFWFMGTSICVIIIANLLSVLFFKETIQRYRPSHNLEIQNFLHFYLQNNGELYRGGQYGFVSSHATNFFAMATIGSLCLDKSYSWLKYILFGAAIIVSYSRVYLGVHYPSDVICGGLFGSCFAYIVYITILKTRLNKLQK
jgi:undecaprenyl-diphosphatase